MEEGGVRRGEGGGRREEGGVAGRVRMGKNYPFSLILRFNIQKIIRSSIHNLMFFNPITRLSVLN